MPPTSQPQPRPGRVRAGLYARQSEGKATSIAEQLAECARDAESQRWQITARYRDKVSASRFANGQTRNDWARVLADIDAGELDVLSLWESSRGDRSLASWAAMLDLCRERGVLVRVVTHGRTYDLSNLRDWRTLAEDGVDSAYESEKISRRVLRATAHAAAGGRPAGGRCPYGYRRVYDERTGKLAEQVPDPQTAPIVVEIIQRVGRGDPVHSIRDDLNRRGVLTHSGSTKWSRNAVRVIAASPAYIGVRIHKGERHPGQWPPLVSEADHYAAVRVLDERAGTRPGQQRWLLSYLARCAECGEPLSGIPGNPARRAPSRYACRRGCASCNPAWLDEVVETLVCRRLAQPDGVVLYQGDDAAVLQARREVERLTARLDEARDQAAAGSMSFASLAHVEKRLLVDIEAANARAVAASVPPALRELAVPDGDPAVRLAEVERRWQALPLPTKREIVDELMTIQLRRGKSMGPLRDERPERIEIEWKHNG